MVLRNPGTPDEAPSSSHTLRDLADLDKLRGWLWYENSSRAGQVYIRPAPGAQHPWLFLDDVARPMAEKIAGRWACLVVETSRDNCQLRILVDRPLPEDERTGLQRCLAVLAKADLGSISGSKWGRLPGYKNRKPGRDCWTNLIADTTTTHPPFPADHQTTTAYPSPAAPAAIEGGRGLPPARRAQEQDAEAAEAGGYRVEFAFACHRLRSGWTPEQVIDAVSDHAMKRGKRRTESQARRYAERTVRAAMSRLR